MKRGSKRGSKRESNRESNKKSNPPKVLSNESGPLCFLANRKRAALAPWPMRGVSWSWGTRILPRRATGWRLSGSRCCNECYKKHVKTCNLKKHIINTHLRARTKNTFSPRRTPPWRFREYLQNTQDLLVVKVATEFLPSISEIFQIVSSGKSPIMKCSLVIIEK